MDIDSTKMLGRRQCDKRLSLGGGNHFHNMKKVEEKVEEKITFLQEEIFMGIRCVQTLALVTLDCLCCCLLCEISHRHLIKGDLCT